MAACLFLSTQYPSDPRSSCTSVIYTSQHNGLVEQCAGALRTLALALYTSRPAVGSTSSAPTVQPRFYHRNYAKDIEQARKRGGAEVGGEAEVGGKSPPELAGAFGEARAAVEGCDGGHGGLTEEGDARRGVVRKWLKQVIERVSDDSIAISRRSSQLSMVFVIVVRGV